MITSPPQPTIIDISDLSPSKKIINNITLLNHPKTLREMGRVPKNSLNDVGQIESLTTSKIKNDVITHQPFNNPYSDEHNRERMINNDISIMFDGNSYTTKSLLIFVRNGINTLSFLPNLTETYF